MNSVDGDDLLADDQFFERSKSTTQETLKVEEEIDKSLEAEIENYISQVAENDCNQIDMSDSPLGSSGA